MQHKNLEKDPCIHPSQQYIERLIWLQKTSTISPFGNIPFLDVIAERQTSLRQLQNDTLPIGWEQITQELEAITSHFHSWCQQNEFIDLLKQ